MELEEESETRERRRMNLAIAIDDFKDAVVSVFVLLRGEFVGFGGKGCDTWKRRIG